MSIQDKWHSRRFDVHIWCEHKQVMELTDTIFSLFTDEEKNKIIGTSNNKGKTGVQKHLRHVLVDQYVSYKLDSRLCTGIARGHKYWKVGSRYNGINLSRKIIPVIDLLIDHKLLDYIGGFHSQSNARRSHTMRIRPSGLLMSYFRNLTIELEDIEFHKCEEVIILNNKDDPDDPKAKPQKYDDNRDTNRMRKEVQAYNNMMFEHFVDVVSLEQPYYLRTFVNKQGFEDTQRIWLTQDNKFTRRTFSRNSFKLNGRWNGGWWQQIEKDLRRDIFIDGSPTIEADYSALHPTILAHQSGNKFKGDPYTIDKQIVHNQRNALKGILLKAINAKTVTSGIQAFTTEQAYDLKKRKITESQVYKRKDLLLLLEAYLDQYPFMTEFIGSDKGIELMYLDSEMVAKVIKYFVEKDKPILPIHDSFIVREEDKLNLQAAMSNAMDIVIDDWVSFAVDEADENNKQYDLSHTDLRWKSWSDRHPNAYYPSVVE